jgi:glycosyltransferase involved in cell wall biosynthesis
MSRAHFFGVLLRRFSGVPCVATAHSAHVQPHFAFNDRVIAVSQATARFHRRWNLVPKSRLDVVHNFVDVSRCAAAPETRERIRASLGLGPRDIALGSVGAIVAEKGLDLLVAAAPAVLDAVPRARFVLVGGGPAVYAARLRAESGRLGVAGAFVWTGPREDVPDVLSALDVFVLASRGENLSMAVLEAMAAGLPVVATAVGGVPEVVAGGETGLLVPPRDSRALAAALVRLAADSETARRLGAAGRARVTTRFSVATQVPLVEAVLTSVSRAAP